MVIKVILLSSSNSFHMSSVLLSVTEPLMSFYHFYNVVNLVMNCKVHVSVLCVDVVYLLFIYPSFFVK